MERIGEIIESSTTWFTAGTYELLESPPFGSLVRAHTRTEGMAIYGLVYEIRTGSKEPGGRAVVRGRTYTGATLYDHEIYREHPDLIEILQTEFSALTVGFVQQERIFQYLPPHPPPVHYSVYQCTSEELALFSRSCEFFRNVLSAPLVPGDELLAATIRSAAQTHHDTRSYLIHAGRVIARLLKDDYDRLTGILERMRPV